MNESNTVDKKSCFEVVTSIADQDQELQEVPSVATHLRFQEECGHQRDCAMMSDNDIIEGQNGRAVKALEESSIEGSKDQVLLFSLVIASFFHEANVHHLFERSRSSSKGQDVIPEEISQIYLLSTY